jgi:hypothetical protein
MILTISKEREFIPEFNNNKTLPACDQIVVKYRAPTITIKSRCRSKPQSKAIADSTGKIRNMEISVDRDDQQTLVEMLLSVHGAAYQDDKGNVVSISNARDLINAPIEFEPLMREIVEHFDSEIDKAELNEKKCE